MKPNEIEALAATLSFKFDQIKKVHDHLPEVNQNYDVLEFIFKRMIATKQTVFDASEFPYLFNRKQNVEQLPRLYELLKIGDINKTGFAGVLPNGNIVDTRIERKAIPVQENKMMNIPMPKLIGCGFCVFEAGAEGGCKIHDRKINKAKAGCVNFLHYKDDSTPEDQKMRIKHRVKNNIYE